MVNSALAARRTSALLSVADGKQRLAEEMAQEDEYQDLVTKLIRDNGGSEEVVKEYATPNAVSGGAKACTELLKHLCSDLIDAAQRTHMDPPECLAMWWPDRKPNAESALGDGGGLIRVNVGMLVQLRLLLHQISSLLATITDNATLWGADDLIVDKGREEFLDMLDEYGGGQRVPLWKTVRVHWGQREYFRRLASIAGLAYVVAHEMGHLVRSDQEYLQAALVTKGPKWEGQKFTETQAVSSFNMELLADHSAIRILNAWHPAQGDLWEFARVVGAASVLAIQSAIFWVEAAATDKPLQWTHPDPEGRIAGVALGLGNPEEFERISRPNPAAIEPIETENSRRAYQFVAWLRGFTGATKFIEAALKRDLTHRGLTPMQLAAIYTVYGTPEKGKYEPQI